MSCIIIQLCITSIFMLQRTKDLGGVILMLNQMVDELVRFFTTFGLIIILFLFIGRFLSEQLLFSAKDYWETFLNIFDAFNGKPNFEQF